MNTAIVSYGTLIIAIVCEVIGTTFLQKSDQFTRLLPTVLMATSYGLSFYFLSVTLKYMPVGIAYAIWSGLGIVLISAIGFVFFRQTLDVAALVGLGFIIVGIIIVNGFSGSLSH
ncbi:DMT family transporter [Mesorhizobium xinjiangense]|uniref:DMT family transporter n=1 Tax=Mesorhizobium xinjiangense TaxID=2678685 RepID=UPI0012ED4E9F|nr:multidrug efflux SMR transporter [Mesorhizobium xinjiangense]